MQLDASRLPDGATLDTDICIVGAGPAGLVLTRELIGLDIDALLLESGAYHRDDWAQGLNTGTVIGDPYVGLRRTRHRQVGGTAQIWNTPFRGSPGAKYVPLDRWDLEARKGGYGGGWPLTWASLEPYYVRAQALAGLGPFAYEAADWGVPERPPLSLSNDVLPSRVYQFGPANLVGEIYPESIRASANVRLCHHATVLRLLADDNGRISAAEIGSRSGRKQVVRARTFVLAGGAIENARLLLVSRLGNGMVGRCFMEHPRDPALTLVPRDPDFIAHAGFYDVNDVGDTTVGGRLALSRETVRELDLPNASVTLFPQPRASSAVGIVARLAERLRHLIAPPPRGGFGWSRVRDPGRFFDRVGLLVNLEQYPHPENRVVLGTETDQLGVPRPVLHWRWRPEEQAGAERLRTYLAAVLEESGVGTVKVNPARAVDPNAHHHAGTTRMSDDPGTGVVDRNGLVFGTENLYVTGASCFPTSGYANPTLSILALAVRLADHLKDRPRS
jgi:choline dehydrogenase-like flavoprotein